MLGLLVRVQPCQQRGSPMLRDKAKSTRQCRPLRSGVAPLSLKLPLIRGRRRRAFRLAAQDSSLAGGATRVRIP